jgi:hypothetical protein
MSKITMLLKGGPKDGTDIPIRIQDPLATEVSVPYKIEGTQQMGVARYVKSIQRVYGKRGNTKIIYNYVNP